MYTYLGEVKLRVFGSLKKSKDHNIRNIVVTSGGSDYYTDPGLVLVDSETRESVDTVSFEVERNSNSIESVTAINSQGLDLKNYELQVFREIYL